MDVTYEIKDTSSPTYCELSPLIPEPVEHINSSSSNTETCTNNKLPIRPTILDLGAPKRPARHLRPPSLIDGNDVSPQRSPGISLNFW